MGAQPLLHQWLPQDDLLLLKSIQGGASLESLARGAVNFSRKFSIKELQDRWQSLLYDPAVSVEDCAELWKLEIVDPPSKTKKFEASKLGNEKRKCESIRSCYYAMRKRVCNGPLYEADMSFLMDNSLLKETGENLVEDPLADNFGLEDCNLDGLFNVSASLLGDEFLVGQENMLEDLVDQNTIRNDRSPNMIRDCNNKAKPPSNSSEIPTWKTMENILQQEIPDNDVGEGILEDTDIHLRLFLSSDMLLDDFDASTSCPDDYFADIAGFSLTNENEMHINDDVNDGIDGTHFLSTLTNEIEEMYNMTNIPDEEKPASVVPPEGVLNLVKGDFTELHTSESKFQSLVDQTSTSTSAFNPRIEYQPDDTICCTLNTSEDVEVPCNEDADFPSEVSANGHRKTRNNATIPSSSGKDKTGTPTIKRIKKSQSTQTLDMGMDYEANRYVVEIGTQGSGGIGQVSTAIKNEYLNEKSGQIEEPIFAATMLKEDDDELVAFENEDQNCDSDSEIPCFSDVESMILDMDLGTVDQEGFYARKVEKYKQEDAMKEIIRLEQNFLSCMQRDTASHGAFAKLFNRRSTHYIKKPEILLGRATGGVHVDIDLTREGPAMKISRRQASMKMERDGTFWLKNLGRCSISVNNEKISPGQSLELLPNCSIEIRNISFIFQVNQRRVKQYLDNLV